jgi:hypothetical protein
VKTGDRVQCLPGALPSSYGMPLGDVVSVGPRTAKVRLCCDGSERRILLTLLKPVPTRR